MGKNLSEILGSLKIPEISLESRQRTIPGGGLLQSPPVHGCANPDTCARTVQRDGSKSDFVVSSELTPVGLPHPV